MSKPNNKTEDLPASNAKSQKIGSGKGKGIHILYRVEGEKATRLRPTCERCGPGYFMADHKDRHTCGHCGFTRYKRS